MSRLHNLIPFPPKADDTQSTTCPLKDIDLKNDVSPNKHWIVLLIRHRYHYKFTSFKGFMKK